VTKLTMKPREETAPIEVRAVVRRFNVGGNGVSKRRLSIPQILPKKISKVEHHSVKVTSVWTLVRRTFSRRRARC
jgi:hypothetical protein